MIVNSDIRVSYQGDGQTKVFPFSFPFVDADYICVKILDENTGRVTKLESDYYVDEVANTVIYPGYAPGEEPEESQQPPILPATSKITIYRSTEISQLIDLGERFPLPDIENALDKITEILQEAKDNIDRSVKIDETSDETPDMYLQEIRESTAQAIESKIAAAASEAAALASQQAAAGSATASANSAAASAGSASAAATSETNAAASEAAAAQSAADLETAVQAASASASAAAGSASAAATSETNAATSASAALTSQQAAAGSASAAATSETNADTSATNAANSATAAAASATHADNTAASIDFHAGYRQPSTAYADGAMATHHDLPYGWFLTCTTAGTTSSGALVIPSPVAEGDTITDGDVEWTVKKIGTGSGDGFAVGDIKQIAHNGTIQDGWLLCDGRAVSRTMFPDLFAKIGTTYGAGDGSTTFNVPDYNTAERFAQGSTVAGTVKQPGLPNIEGEFGARSGTGQVLDAETLSGVFSLGSNSGVSTQIVNATSGAGYKIAFDASLSNPIYGNSTTVQPNALTCRYIIKAYDGVTPTPAEADISEMLAELTGKADRGLGNLSATGEARFANIVKMPDWENEIAVTNTANGFTYTAPADGYLKLNRSGSDGGATATLYLGSNASGTPIGNTIVSNHTIAGSASSYADGMKIMLIPTKANQTYYFVTTSISIFTLTFVPFKD